MGFGIASGILGIAGGVLGTYAKKDAIERQQKGIKTMQGENTDWYNRRYNEDPTQRADTLRLLQMTEEAIKKRNQIAEGRRAVMGGTEESVAAEKEANSGITGNIVSNIAAANQARKDQIEQQYIKRKNELSDRYYGLEGDKPSEADYASSALAGLSKGLGSGGGEGLSSLFSSFSK